MKTMQTDKEQSGHEPGCSCEMAAVCAMQLAMGWHLSRVASTGILWDVAVYLNRLKKIFFLALSKSNDQGNDLL